MPIPGLTLARTMRYILATIIPGNIVVSKIGARIIGAALLLTASGGLAVEPPPLHEVAAAHGFASPQLAAAAVQVVKRRVDALLREVVAETVTDEGDVDDELAELRRVVVDGRP